MTDIIIDDRAKMVETRMELYLHLAKRMVIDQFGPASEHDHNQITADIAAAMVNLESAHVIADAEQYG